MWRRVGRTESAEIDGLERRRAPSSIGAPIAGRYCKAGAVSDTLTRLRRMGKLGISVIGTVNLKKKR